MEHYERETPGYANDLSDEEDRKKMIKKIK
jgi:hypothetical protein